MKILIYSPYLATLGGGERYLFEVIEFFLKREDEVHLAWQEEKIKNLAKERFNLEINEVKINNDLYRTINRRKNLLEKYKITSSYDIVFFVSDGSIPFLFGKKNFLHFQVPFKRIRDNKLFNQIKLKFINKIICNSFFTKKFIDQELGVQSEVLYPPVSREFKTSKKERIILSVGRFDNLLNNKKQDILVGCFKDLIKETELKNWKLILIGNVLGKNSFVGYLKKIAKGYPIEIKTNIEFSLLKNLYAKAKIYWHAAGLGEDLYTNPEKAEHFGISVVEAMNAGCVPIVFNGGGLPEIVQDKKNGFLFNNLSDLKEITLKVINSEALSKEISQEAMKKGKRFTKEVFYKKLNEIIQ